MKTFQTFTQLKAAYALTGELITVLEPTRVQGIVEATGEGFTLLSGNIFVPSFVDIDAIIGRKTSLLDAAFASDLTVFLNTYMKDVGGEWIPFDGGLTSTIYLNGQIWYPEVELTYDAVGYQVQSWSTDAEGALQVVTDKGTFKYLRYLGVDVTAGGGSGSGGAGIPIGGKAAFADAPPLYVATDGTEWLRTGWISTDVETYPDARTDTFKTKWVGNNVLPANNPGNLSTGVVAVGNTVWSGASNGICTERDGITFVATGRTATLPSPGSVAFRVANLAYDPVLDMLVGIDDTYGYVSRVKLDGTGGEIVYMKGSNTPTLNPVPNSTGFICRGDEYMYISGSDSATTMQVYDRDMNFLRTQTFYPGGIPNTNAVIKGYQYNPVTDELISGWSYSYSNSNSYLMLQSTDMETGEHNWSYAGQLDNDIRPIITRIIWFVVRPFNSDIVAYDSGSAYAVIESPSTNTYKDKYSSTLDTAGDSSSIVEAGGFLWGLTTEGVLYKSTLPGSMGVATTLPIANYTVAGMGTTYSIAALNDRLWTLDYTNQIVREIGLDGVLTGVQFPVDTSNGNTNSRYMASDGTFLYTLSYSSTGTNGMSKYDETGTFIEFLPGGASNNTGNAAWDGKQWWMYYGSYRWRGYDATLTPLDKYYQPKSWTVQPVYASYLSSGYLSLYQASNKRQYLFPQNEYNPTPYVGDPTAKYSLIKTWSQVTTQTHVGDPLYVRIK